MVGSQVPNSFRIHIPSGVRTFCDLILVSTASTARRQISSALRASPATAETFFAQNCIAIGSRTLFLSSDA